jgi:hypothetical protein
VGLRVLSAVWLWDTRKKQALSSWEVVEQVASALPGFTAAGDPLTDGQHWPGKDAGKGEPGLSQVLYRQLSNGSPPSL